MHFIEPRVNVFVLQAEKATLYGHSVWMSTDVASFQVALRKFMVLVCMMRLGQWALSFHMCIIQYL